MIFSGNESSVLCGFNDGTFVKIDVQINACRFFKICYNFSVHNFRLKFLVFGPFARIFEVARSMLQVSLKAIIVLG